MPWSEDDGDGGAVIGLERLEEVRHAGHPRVEFLLDGVVVEDLRHYGGVAHIPSVASRDGIAGVPTDGDDATPLMVLDDGVVDACEGHAVEVLRVGEFDASEVEAHDGGIVAHCFQHVASLHSRHGVSVPCQSVEGVVLVPVHIAFLLQGLQPVEQLLGSGFHGLWFVARGKHDGSYCQQCEMSHVILSAFVPTTNSPTRPTVPGTRNALSSDRR